MEVRCPSCSTQYEFDPDQLEPGGTNVRCSACGQVFKVHAQTADEQGKWMVRRSATQEIIYFDDLATLQRWIVERKVERDDEMSEDGASWQRLGAASELDAFFHLVDRAGVGQDAGAPPWPALLRRPRFA